DALPIFCFTGKGFKTFCGKQHFRDTVKAVLFRFHSTEIIKLYFLHLFPPPFPVSIVPEANRSLPQSAFSYMPAGSNPGSSLKRSLRSGRRSLSLPKAHRYFLLTVFLPHS